MPPTRATRQQRKAAGSEASPFQVLETDPGRKRTTRKKPAIKENTRSTVPKKKKTDAKIAPDLARQEKENIPRSDEQPSSMTPDRSLSANTLSNVHSPPSTPCPLPPKRLDPKTSLCESEVSQWFETTAQVSTASETVSKTQKTVNPVAQQSANHTFHLYGETISVNYFIREGGHTLRHLKQKTAHVPKAAFLEFLAMYTENTISHNLATQTETTQNQTKVVEHRPVNIDEEVDENVEPQLTDDGDATSPHKSRASRLKRALDKKKDDELKRAEEQKDSAERAKEKAQKARAKATVARANATAKGRKAAGAEASLVPDSPSPSPSPPPQSPPKSFVEDSGRRFVHSKTSTLFPSEDRFNDTTMGNTSDETPQTPGRWGLTSMVGNSISKLNPFSFFGRRTLAAKSPSTSPPPSPLSRPNSTTIKRTDRKFPPHPSVENEANGQRSVQQPGTSESNTSEQALTVSSPEESEQKLLEYIAKTHPALLANPQTIENLKATLNQYEILERVKAQQKQLEAQNTQATTQGLVAQPPAPSATPVAGVKRKRKAKPSPDVIPNPHGQSYGMDLDYFCSSSESGEEDTSDEAPDQTTPPNKKQKLVDPALEERLRGIRQRRERLFGDPRKPQPYVGGLFEDPKNNIFEGYENFPASAAALTNTRPQPTDGQFSVPDTSSSSSEDEGAEGTAKSSTTPTSSKKVTFSSEEESSDAERGQNAQASKTTTPRSILKGSPNYVKPAQTQAPPPAPIPAHATLPATQTAAPASDALALARAQANKYAPKVSSNLRESSRMSSSPMAGQTTPISDNTNNPMLTPITEKLGLAASDTAPSPAKSYSLEDLHDFDMDAVVVNAISNMSQGLIPNPVTDFEMSDEVFGFLNQLSP